jgi:hypothetical protein
MIKRIILITALFCSSWQMAQSQVLISLLLGDKLNSGKMKFGLDLGANFSNITNINPSKIRTGFHLGFYFDILLKEKKNWWLHTGVIVKSSMGANALAPYSLDDPDLDSLFSNGGVDRKINYYNVPILVRYKFKKEFFIELGTMLGLSSRRTKDVFYADINSKKDLTYNNKIIDEMNRIDMGVMAGIGYHLLKGSGMNFGIRYYQGLRNIPKIKPDKPQYNQSLYLFVSFPVGAGAKAKEKAKEQADKKAAKKAKKQKTGKSKSKKKKGKNDK